MSKPLDISRLVRPNVLAMKPYASARSEYMASDGDTILLDANENPFETEVNRYPDPTQRKLRQAIAKRRGLDPDQIFFGNGSDEVLDLLFRVFCEPGKDAVLTMPPTFGMFKVLSELNQIQRIEVPLTPKFQIDTEAVLNSVTVNCKMILLCSPNNPTGNSFSWESIKTLLRDFNGILVVDEAYIDFSPHQSWVGEINSNKNLVVTQTMSKAYGQAGIRLGMAFAHPEIIALLEKIKLPYNVNALTQRKALERIQKDEILKQEIHRLQEEKAALYIFLKEIPWIHTVFPSDANFILVRVDNGDARYFQLLDHGVVVRNRSGQVHCENTLRITIGTPEENVRLKQILKDMT